MDGGDRKRGGKTKINQCERSCHPYQTTFLNLSVSQKNAILFINRPSTRVPARHPKAPGVHHLPRDRPALTGNLTAKTATPTIPNLPRRPAGMAGTRTGSHSEFSVAGELSNNFEPLNTFASRVVEPMTPPLLVNLRTHETPLNKTSKPSNLLSK